MSKDKINKREMMKHRRSQKQRKNRLLIGAGLTLIALIAVIWLRGVNPSKPSANTLDVAENLPNTDSAFNVGTRIGQSAPAFTLPDANGQPYEFHAGDGRKYVFAFNMGYV